MTPVLCVFDTRPKAVKMAPVVGRLLMMERSPYGDGPSAGRIVHALASRHPGGSDAVEQAG